MVEKDLGFVLRRHNFRETSIIATLYTLRFGKISVILKGFYTIKKEFSTPFDTFSLNEIMVYPKKREIWLVSFAELFNDYEYLRKNISKARVAAVFLSIIDKTMAAWDPHPEVFYLLRDTLALMETEDEDRLLYIFLTKFLTLSGIKPEFDRCINCHGDITSYIFFSAAKGGLVCNKCSHKVKGITQVSRETSSSFFYIQDQKLPIALRLKPSARCQNEILHILKDFAMYHLDLDIFAKLPLKI